MKLFDNLASKFRKSGPEQQAENNVEAINMADEQTETAAPVVAAPEEDFYKSMNENLQTVMEAMVPLCDAVQAIESRLDAIEFTKSDSAPEESEEDGDGEEEEEDEEEGDSDKEEVAKSETARLEAANLELQEKLKSALARIEAIEAQPAAVRAPVMGVGAEPTGVARYGTHAEVLEKLTKGAMAAEVTPMDVMTFEKSRRLSPRAEAYLKGSN